MPRRVKYDSFPVYLAVRTNVGSGSVHLMVARRLSRDMVCFTYLLIDLWKLGLKDGFGSLSMEKERFDEMFNAMVEEVTEQGFNYHPIDISEAKWLVAQGLRIAEKVGIKAVSQKWINIVGDLSEIKIDGSLYKCYKCERGELPPEADNYILKIAKREVRIAGTPKETKLLFLCKNCERKMMESEEKNCAYAHRKPN
ncbi:hypothetical protein KEJ34_06520 [Candidatus Bathyarchaeota archaeon]|nr:hypothetical protein [Candidatus Bathyarchaeota archaeon]